MVKEYKHNAGKYAKLTNESTRQSVTHSGVCPMYSASAVYGPSVFTRSGGKSWECRVIEEGTQHRLGTFSTEGLAAEAVSW